MLNLLGGFDGTARLATLPHEDTCHLNGTDASKEEVHSGEPIQWLCLARVRDSSAVGLHIQDVTGLNDHAPAGPDGTSAHQSSVLGEGELVGGTGEVGDTGDDQAPLS